MSTLLFANFETPERARAAAGKLRQSGHTVREVYAPIPSAELEHLVGAHKSRIRQIMLVAGIIGALTGFLMQVWSAVLDYPINSGGRPLLSWPAFMLVTFELAVLFAALSGFVAFLAEARLTRLHAPMFAADSFERASCDRFVLEIETKEPSAARRILEGAGATPISEHPA